MKIFIAVTVAVIFFIGIVYVWNWMQDEPEQVKRKPARKRKPRQTAGRHPDKIAQAGADLKRDTASPQPETMNTDRGTAGQAYNGSGKVKPEPVIKDLTPEWKQPERDGRGRA